MAQYFAQFGEDRVLNRIFGGKTSGCCVEVGGFDGVTGSNSLYFERLGWRCLVVEPMPDYCAKIQASRQCELLPFAASDINGEMTLFVAEGVEALSTIEDNNAHFERIHREGCQNVRQISVPVRRLDDALTEKNVDSVDFMTIDVEGHELSALKGLSLDVIAPRIVLIEDNSSGTNHEVRDYMSNYSYIRFYRTGCNDWYAKVTDKELVTPWRMLSLKIKLFAGRTRNLLKPLRRLLSTASPKHTRN